MGDDDGAADAAEQRTCRSMLGIDCVLPLNHAGRHIRQHEDDLRQADADGE